MNKVGKLVVDGVEYSGIQFTYNTAPYAGRTIIAGRFWATDHIVQSAQNAVDLLLEEMKIIVTGIGDDGAALFKPA